MGTLTLSDLREEVKSHLADRDDITDVQYNRAINLAQERMARSHDFRELSFSLSHTAAFADDPAVDKFLPFSALTLGGRDIKKILSFVAVDGTNSNKIERKTPSELDRLVPVKEVWSTFRPSIYTEWREQFEFWKIPDKSYVYDIRLMTWALDLSVDGTASDFDHKDDVIINLTVSGLFNRVGEYERAGRFFGIFNALWKDAITSEMREPDRVIKPPQNEPSGRSSSQYWLDPFVRGVD